METTSILWIQKISLPNFAQLMGFCGFAQPGFNRGFNHGLNHMCVKVANPALNTNQP